MVCKLCLQDKKLLKKSHIVPNFMYKGMFGANNKLININLHNLQEKSIVYSGVYDKEILCTDCDGKLISTLESYASNCIYFNGSPRRRSHIRMENILGNDDTIPAIRLHNLDYAKTKLFFLSILWRAHISRHPFFSEVELGKYGEELRKMILTGKPGDEDRFEVILILIDSNGTRPDKAVIAPRKVAGDGNTYYVFHINQIMYHFNVSPYNRQSLFEKGIIRRDGTMDIAIISEDYARGYFDSFMGRSILMKSKIKL